MKAETTLVSTAAVLSMASLVASAEEMNSSFSWGNVTFQPRAYVGYADYDLKSGDFIFTNQNGRSSIHPLEMDIDNRNNLQFSGPIGGIGGTVAMGGGLVISIIKLHQMKQSTQVLMTMTKRQLFIMVMLKHNTKIGRLP